MSSAEDVNWGLRHTAELLTAEELERLAREDPPRHPALPAPGSVVGFLRTHLVRIAGGPDRPPSRRGIQETVSSALQTLKGPSPQLFLVQLRERLAFEQTRARLHACLLEKTRAEGGYPGGPTPARLVELHLQEMEHLNLVRECIHRLGGSAPALTTSEDDTGPRLQGLLQVAEQPGATLQDALRAVLVSEIINHTGWALLVELTQELGPADMVDAFREVLRAETLHLGEVTEWVANLPDEARAQEALASNG
ncbi:MULTISPECIES: hypothetical protein [Corallococcus]|uniref:hypothetical protein n=1 Tax=Corallococcus TaxID=83461 RepID=UPI001180B4AB|nr:MULTISPECIES: hypothetical protein [Corallococcus]NBD12232.1 hypothetical protein [Corallococcus silvisoli]TSC25186.1 hypothetical protein FOF48_24960 [Corallococcus sp. Z5C101001]